MFWNNAKRTDRIRKATRPVIEGLEGRRLLTVTVTEFTDLDGNEGLWIQSDNAGDVITVTDNPSTNVVVVSSPGLAGGPFVSTNEPELIIVKATGGTDTVFYNVTNNYDSGDARHIELDLGNSSDTLAFSMGSYDIQGDANITIDIDGDPGDDVVSLSFNDVRDEAKLSVYLHGEDGNDNANVFMQQVLDYATVELELDLGNGYNTLNFTMDPNEDEVVQNESILDVNIVGGTHNDSVNIFFNEDVSGQVHFDAYLNGGNDKFVALLGDDFDVYDPTGIDENGFFRINAHGGWGHDLLKVEHQPDDNELEIDQDAFLGITLLGGDGNDTIKVDLLDGASPNEIYIGGTLKIRLNGGNQNDWVLARLRIADAFDDGRLDLQVRGGQHNDGVDLTLADATGGTLIYTGGYALVDGGLGTDNSTVIKNVDAKIRRQLVETGGPFTVI